MLLSLLSWLGAEPALAQEKIALTFAPDVPAQLAELVTSAVAGQLTDLPMSQAAPCRVKLSRMDRGLKLALLDEAGHERSVRSLSASSDELMASEAASVVRAFVLGARVGTPALVTQTAPEPIPTAEGTPPPAFAPPPRKDPVSPTRAPLSDTFVSRRLWLSVLYTGSTYARQLPWQSGIRGELSMRLWARLHVGVGYAYHPAVEVSGEIVSVRLRDQGPSVLFGFQSRRGRLSFGGDLLAGINVTRRETLGTPGSVVSTAPSNRWSGLIGLRARGRLQVIERCWIDIAPTLELDFGQAALVVEEGGLIPMLSPRSVRARLDLGGSFDVL